MLKRLLIATICSGSLALGACADSTQSPAEFTGPALPFPSKDPAWVTSTTLPAGAAELTSPGADYFVDMNLHATGPDIEYAAWRFGTGQPAPAPLSVTPTFKPQGDSEIPVLAWVGVANYAAGVWNFFGPFDVTPTIPIGADYLSPAGNVWVAVLTYGGGRVSVEQVSLEVDVAGDGPYAEIYSEDPRSVPPFFVSLSAGSSAAAPGRTLTNYEWDLDGDEVFSEPGDEADSEGSPTTAMNPALHNDEPGSYIVRLRVTDDQAAQATASLTVKILGTPVVPIDAGFDAAVGQDCSLAVINGKPAVSYYDATNGNLKYAYSSTAGGDAASDWTVLTVDASADDVGRYTSLAEVNGAPAISYQNATTGELLYAYSSEPDGSSGWTSISLDGSESAGQHTSLAVFQGRPAIAYGVRNEITMKRNLWYVYSSTAGGTAPGDWTKLVVDTQDNAGAYISLKEVNGNPAMSYARDGSVENFGALKYALSSAPDGSAGWTVLAIDAPEIVGVGGFTSLAVINGKPAISYSNLSGFSALMYAHSSTVDGANLADWSTVIAYQEGFNLSGSTSLVEVDGRPAISFCNFNSSEGNLLYAYSSTPDGASETDWKAYTADNDNNEVFASTSMAIVDGRPAVAYFYDNGADLHFARPDPAFAPPF